jgi:hypothetical protein
MNPSYPTKITSTNTSMNIRCIAACPQLPKKK